MFQQTLRPDLVALLRENLPPLNPTLLEFQEFHNTSNAALVSKLSEHYERLSSGVEEIRQQIDSSKITQHRIESCLQGDISRGRQRALPRLEHYHQDVNTTAGCLDDDLNDSANKPSVKMVQESLRKV
jgi:hypothetical protein